MVNKKPKIDRKNHKLDAQGQSLGRLASQIAILLMGKNKPTYERNIDNGDFVFVNNIKEVKITGKKLEQKTYYRHSTQPGNLKKLNMGKLFSEKPGEVLKKAVYHMLPKNKLRESMIKRLNIK